MLIIDVLLSIKMHFQFITNSVLQFWLIAINNWGSFSNWWVFYYRDIQMLQLEIHTGQIQADFHWWHSGQAGPRLYFFLKAWAEPGLLITLSGSGLTFSPKDWAELDLTYFFRTEPGLVYRWKLGNSISRHFLKLVVP